jgi:hypothetical protein
MAIIGKLENGRLLVRETVAGPVSYATATPPTIVFSDLSQVEEVIALHMEAGFVASNEGLVDQTLTFRIRAQEATATDDDPFREITDGQNRSGEDIVAVAVGR